MAYRKSHRRMSRKAGRASRKGGLKRDRRATRKGGLKRGGRSNIPISGSFGGVKLSSQGQHHIVSTPPGNNIVSF